MAIQSILTPEEQQRGLQGQTKEDGFVQSIAEPFLKATTSGINTIAGTGSLLASLPGGISQEEMQKIGESTTKERDFGFLGKARPVGINQETGEELSTGRGIADIIGTGLEIGSYAAPASVGANVVKGAGKATLGQAVKGLGIGGVVAGTSGGVGAELQNQDATAGSVVGSGVIGGTIGGVAGGALAGAGKLGSKAFEKAVPLVRNVSSKAVPVAKNIGESVTSFWSKLGRGVKEAAGEAIELQASPIAIRDAVKAGLSKESVDFVQTATPHTQQQFGKMVNIAKNSIDDVRSLTQSKEVAGESLLRRVSHLIDNKGTVGKKVGKLMDDAPNVVNDVTDIYGEMVQELSNKGIQVRANGTLRSVGGVDPSDIKFYETFLRRLRPNQNGQVLRTARNLNDTRKLLRSSFSASERQQQALSSEVKSFVGRYRSRLIDPVEKVVPGYREAITDFAQVMQALEEFIKLIGFKGDVDSLLKKDLRVGEVVSRILGNAADRPLSIINNIEKEAVDRGFKQTDSVIDLIQFADILEDVAGTSQTRSLRGQVGRAGTDVTGAAADAARMNAPGLLLRASKTIQNLAKQDRLKALDELLKSIR